METRIFKCCALPYALSEPTQLGLFDHLPPHAHETNVDVKQHTHTLTHITGEKLTLSARQSLTRGKYECKRASYRRGRKSNKVQDINGLCLQQLLNTRIKHSTRIPTPKTKPHV